MLCVYGYFVFFFFKQKTAYEMRISDWSSDVCSSDLLVATPLAMVLAFDGARYVELTAEHDALDTEVSPFGPSPTTGAAFLLGFARAPENGAAAVFPEEIRLHL